jgi:tartrate-resistant acid phosphatase type 5
MAKQRPEPIIINNINNDNINIDDIYIDDNDIIIEKDKDIYYTFIADFGYPIDLNSIPILKNLKNQINRMNNDSMLLMGGDLLYDMKKSIEENYNNFIKYYNIECEFYGILGNHDYYINPSYYIDNKLFNMKNWYYTIKKDNIVFYMIDTMLLNTRYHDVKQYSVCKGHNIVCNQFSGYSTIYEYLQKDMLLWLDDNLKDNSDKINIVIGHYPLKSTAHYKNYCKETKDLLFPILKKHKVPVYICGHEHNTQHTIISEDDYQLNHIISGGCIDTRHYLDEIDDVLFYSIDLIILKFKIINNFISFRFHNTCTNEIVYSFDITL